MRNNRIECPAHCPFNPFGAENYDAWLQVDGTWMPKVLDFTRRHVPHDEYFAIIDKMRCGQKGNEESEIGAIVATTIYTLARRRDEAGHTLADLWEANGWEGLNNDERVMMRYRRNSYPTILEVQRILDGQRIEMVDLLSDGAKRFLVFDRSMAAVLKRFDRLVTWLTHYPHFSRPLSFGLLLSQPVYGDAIEELRRRSTLDGLSPCDWLVENFSTFARWITDESRRRITESIRNSDMNHCQAVYRLKAGAPAIRSILERKPELSEQTPPEGANLPEPLVYYDWVRLGESKQLERKLPAMFGSSDDGTMIGSVGSLWLYKDRIMVESMSRLRFGFARELIEKWLRGMIEFFQEGVVDLGGQFADEQSREESAAAASNAPASKVMFGSWRIDSDEDAPEGGGLSPETEAAMLTKAFRHHYEKFIADRIPALDGMTPMEAAQDLSMRPRLVELMKSHVNGIERQGAEKDLDLNIDWVLQRLGLRELLA